MHILRPILTAMLALVAARSPAQDAQIAAPDAVKPEGTATEFVGPPAPLPDAALPATATPAVEPEPAAAQPAAAPAAPPVGAASTVEKSEALSTQTPKPASVPTGEAESPPIGILARDVFERGVEARVWQSVIAASVVGSDVTIARFGHLQNADDPAPDDATRFQLGGVTAAYTGILLADLAATGKVRLSDPVSAFLPAGAGCADARVCAITLAELASGRSGLPALPANLFPRDPHDALRDYDEAELLAFLATYRPAQWPAGSGDSLLADGLLGWALGRAHGGGYATALRERVLVPLGLASTEGDDTSLAPGHAGGVAVGPLHYGALAGAGGLRSNARDQLALLKAMLRPDSTPLRNALLLARQPHDDDAARGLGWRLSFVDTGGQSWPIVWQRGESGGHASFIGFRADRQQGLVLLAGSAADVSRFGLAMLAGQGVPAAPFAGPATATAALADYTGMYAFEPGREVVIRSRDGALSAQVAGQLAVRLIAGGEDAFATADASIQIMFERGEKRRVDALRWTERGINVPARRLSDRAPQVERTAYPVDATQLAAQCGEYADAGLVARLSCTNGNVYFQLTGSAARPMIAYAPDRFATADGEIELRVARDASGSPSALVLNLLGRELALPRVVATVPNGAEPAGKPVERDAKSHKSDR
jgi:CubicO group peptidase (beta-lactamase class C family)